MDFKSLFHKILKVSQETLAPQSVTEAFNNQFDSPLNTEWHKTDEFFEAVFYKDELEHIAKYHSKGEFISLKINLPIESIPENICEAIKSQGEIMSAIKINCKEVIKFEFIVRDQDLIRYSLLLDAKGEILDKKIV